MSRGVSKCLPRYPSRLLVMMTDLIFLYLCMYVVRKISILRSMFDIQRASVARIMSEGSHKEPVHACRELSRTLKEPFIKPSPSFTQRGNALPAKGWREKANCPGSGQEALRLRSERWRGAHLQGSGSPGADRTPAIKVPVTESIYGSQHVQLQQPRCLQQVPTA